MNGKIFRTGIYARLSREDSERGESNSITSHLPILFDFFDDTSNS